MDRSRVALVLLLGLVLVAPAAGQKPASGGKVGSATLAEQRKEADLLYASGKTEEAKAAYLQIAPSFKDDFEFNKRLAYCFSVSPKKEMGKAALYYGRAYALNPKDRGVEINWGKALSWSKQYPEAVKVFQRVVAREPNNRDALLELARAQSYGGQADAAQASYQEYLKRWPKEREVRLEYASFLGWSKHPEEAMENFRAVLQADPRNPTALVGEGQILAWQGKLEEAVQRYDTVLARLPNHYGALHGKAFALLWLQRYAEAEKTFARANRIKPPDSEMQEAMRRIARWKAEEPQRRRQAELDVYLKPAEAALSHNDLPKAIQLFRQALDMTPQDEAICFRLGQAYLWNQQWEEASEIFQKLWADHPENLQALRELGHAQSGAKKLADAAATFRLYLERSPDISVRVDLARVLSWSGQVEAARTEYTKVLAEQPDNFEAALGLAQVASWQGQTEDALKRFDELLRQRPGNRDALLGKAQVLSWTGHSKESVSILEELRRTLPEDREVANILASVEEAQRQQEAQAQGGPPRAEDQARRLGQLEQAAQKDPNDVAAWQRLGDMQSENRDFKSAIASYEKALALRPADTDLQLTLARVASWNRDYPRSIELYRALVAQKPDSRMYRIELARILSWSGHNSESIETYKQILQANPKDTEARMGLAQVLSWDKRLDESLAEYQRIVQADPGNREALLQQARVYSWRGDLNTAMRLYDGILIQAPSDREARLGKAQVLNWSGQPLEAKRIIDDVQKKYPNDRDVAMANASVQTSLGRKDLALQQLDELDKLQPGDRDTAALRRSIRQDMRPTLILGITPSSDSDDTRIYASTATLYFSLTPRLRSYIATNFFPTSTPNNGSEVGTEFLFGSYGRVADWLQLRGEIGGNAATAGEPSVIGGGGASVFVSDKMQFDLDVGRRFLNYLATPIRLNISRVQLRGAWNWRPTQRTNLHFDYFHEEYSDTNSNNGLNVSILETLVKRERIKVDAGYLFANSGFTSPAVNSGYYAPTAFQRHAGLGNVRINFAARTGLSFWGSLGGETVENGPYRMDGTARASWDYKLSSSTKISLGYGYFAVSSVASTGAYVTHTGYVTLEHVF